VLVLAAALMLFGVLRLHDAPVDALPEFKPPMVEIQTEALWRAGGGRALAC
jgi:Cu/Ag efflux pump CusA